MEHGIRSINHSQLNSSVGATAASTNMREKIDDTIQRKHQQLQESRTGSRGRKIETDKINLYRMN